MNYIEENRKRSLWFKSPDNKNCYYFPQGWCDEFVDEFNGDEDGPELYGYLPEKSKVNSPVFTGYYAISLLKKEGLVEVTETEARKLHPKLAKYLDDINAGLDPDYVCPEESVILRKNGQEVRVPAFPRPCEYVRVVDSDGDEVVYWSNKEWQEDPDLSCIGAIFGAIKQVAEAKNVNC